MELPELYYNTWCNMKSRCNNSNHPNYNLYGGKGISICSEWLDYNNFLQWAKSTGWKVGLTLERLNNNDNYCPENCIWVTQSIQAKNTSRIIKIDNLSLREYCSLYNLNYSTIRARIRLGLSPKEAADLGNNKLHWGIIKRRN